MPQNDIKQLSTLLRYYSIMSTTAAGSGHPTSCLSSADLMSVLFFGGHYRFDLEHPEYHNNDRVIFSKGHAAPLLYALYAAAGKVSEDELQQLRDINSPLEGHPTPEFAFTEAATGSLGQGLSIGVGMALNAKYLDKLPYRTYVLLGDSEMAEGSNWEAMQLAAHYKLDNLIGILDVNRLGQRGETMYGHDVKNYKSKCEAFGWKVLVIDGHNHKDIDKAYTKAASSSAPVMIIAKTDKGHGVSFLANKDNWHGTALSEEEAKKAYAELGSVDTKLRGKIQVPERRDPTPLPSPDAIPAPPFDSDEPMATREAYGYALQELLQQNQQVVVLDGETSNSTKADKAKDIAPKRFFEMYIAEQNMAGVALGLSRRGKIPFASTFAAFWTRAHDQIRMSQYSDGNVKYVGSHAGVSIGEDGASQMALEDIALFRAMHDSVVLYPSDAISTRELVKAAADHHGNVFIRTTRPKTPRIYDTDDADFQIGGSRVLKHSKKDTITIVAAGITLHEALAAYNALKKEGIIVRVIDLYSIKPLDTVTLNTAAEDTSHIICVEDHYPEGGLGEAVVAALTEFDTPVHIMAVNNMPHSGTKDELLAMEGINAAAIVEKVKQLVVL